jgi:hypothetical protein
MTGHTTTRTDPIDRFLAQLRAGQGISSDLFTADAVLDATVPNWRFEQTGADAVAAQFSRWYDVPASIESVNRQPISRRRAGSGLVPRPSGGPALNPRIPGGEIVELDLSWVEDGIPHASHQIHVITVADGRICADTVFCGGRWSATLLAEMEEARAH